jgi:predicted membrane GTPase involved in stress response
MEQMTTDADGRVRMEYVLPVRGLSAIAASS